MRRYVKSVLLGLVFMAGSGNTAAASDIPDRFHGRWAVEIKTDDWNPWWADYKYPVVLEISDQKREFTDQAGNQCAPKMIFYDEAIDELVFIHCLPTKHEISFRPFYRFKEIDGRLIGNVWTYRALFGLMGTK